MAQIYGPEYLKAQLTKKQQRVALRYRYYEQKVGVKDFGISTPPSLMNTEVRVGWATKAVDALANRLNVRSISHDVFDVNALFEANNKDILFKSAFTSALISACSFIYIYDDEGTVKLQNIDGRNATGTIDPVTNLLTEGLAVLERDNDDRITRYAYFEPGKTTFYNVRHMTSRSKDEPDGVIEYPINLPLLVPVIYRPDAARPFGHSRISRAAMNYIDEAARTLKRSEIAAEFYSFPQRWITGLDQDAQLLDKWQATMSSLIQIDRGTDGNVPTLGQFTQQSMSPHVDQLRMFAGMFAGETGLTLDDLGFPSDNPTSSEAIKAGHETLRLDARAAQNDFEVAIRNIVYTAMCLKDGNNYNREAFARLEVKWAPVFEPDLTAIGAAGDAIFKINEAMAGAIDADAIRDLTGLEVK
ncbi:MAG: phage portal protein [Clostridia bacterium]|nr:phage portal protein [Clostridia bacterium]